MARATSMRNRVVTAPRRGPRCAQVRRNLCNMAEVSAVVVCSGTGSVSRSVAAQASKRPDINSSKRPTLKRFVHHKDPRDWEHGASRTAATRFVNLRGQSQQHTGAGAHPRGIDMALRPFRDEFHEFLDILVAWGGGPFKGSLGLHGGGPPPPPPPASDRHVSHCLRGPDLFVWDVVL
jgi:hypothetical protein